MDRGEPTLVPQWLKNNGSSGSGSGSCRQRRNPETDSIDMLIINDRAGDEGGSAEREEEEELGVRGGGAAAAAATMMSRKEKRKAMKTEKRKHSRKVRATKEREEELARMNDPEETIRIEEAEREEAAARDRAVIEFEEREKVWAERKMREDEEERKALEEELETKEKLNHAQRDEVNGDVEDDGWEYVEEGPAEIIWKGNEIIVKKKKVRVPKKDGDRPRIREDADRPTSNPLPPQSEAFADYNSSLVVSAQQLLENVASQVPNFGTEQDKAHCPFHLKTGACRFGQRCSRVHFYPDKSCTLLIRNMYNGPGLAWEQDEGLEYTDEETEHCYEEFYEDVHTEFLKFGELVNFKVCRNGSFHLRGNVYVHYKSVDSAILAYHSLEGRYFAGKQVKFEFVNVTRWKVAICGEYIKLRYKTCSHGTTCNFIHCFRNPGGEYEWADWDKPPPRYWIKQMVALFCDCEDYEEDKWITPGKSSHQLRKRSRSRERECSFKGRSRGSYVNEDSFKSRRNNLTGGKPNEHGDYEDSGHGHHSHDTAADGDDGDGRPVDKEKDGRSSHSHTKGNLKRTRHRDSEFDNGDVYKLDESTVKEDWPGHSSSRSLKHRKKGRREGYSQGSAYGSESTDVDDPDKHRSTRHGKKSRTCVDSWRYHDSDIEDRWDPKRYSPEAVVEKHEYRKSSTSSRQAEASGGIDLDSFGGEDVR